MTTHLDLYPDALNAAHGAALQFLEGLSQRPVAVNPSIPPLSALPLTGLGTAAALDQLRTSYESGMSGSAGPRYFGFVTGGSTPAALAGDWLAAAYDQNLSNDVGSIATHVEREALGWLRELFGLPDSFHGSFVSGATASNTSALATARQWAYARLGWDAAEQGLCGAPPVAVLAGAAHSSVDKALAILGWGRRALTRLPLLPGRTALDLDALAAALRAQHGAPAVVVASAGEVNTGDFDDLQAIARLCAEHDAWLHVDGAFGLFAALSPAHTQRLEGLQLADSVTVDLHKWLNVPYDSALVYTCHPQQQRAVYRASSAYLGDSTDPLHYTPENSRRFRALPAWLSLAAYGREGIAAWVQRCNTLAEQLGARIAAHPAFELLAPVQLNTVCFALRGPPDAARRDRLLAQLQADGRVFMTLTVLFGRPAIRAALSNWRTSEADLDVVMAALGECVERV